MLRCIQLDAEVSLALTSGFAPTFIGHRKTPTGRSARRSECSLPSEKERDDGQNDEYDDEPFGDLHAEAGNPTCTENARDDREYQKQDREFDEAPSELERSYLCGRPRIPGCLAEYHGGVSRTRDGVHWCMVCYAG